MIQGNEAAAAAALVVLARGSQGLGLRPRRSFVASGALCRRGASSLERDASCSFDDALVELWQTLLSTGRTKVRLGNDRERSNATHSSRCCCCCWLLSCFQDAHGLRCRNKDGTASATRTTVVSTKKQPSVDKLLQQTVAVSTARLALCGAPSRAMPPMALRTCRCASRVVHVEKKWLWSRDAVVLTIDATMADDQRRASPWSSCRCCVPRNFRAVVSLLTSQCGISGIPNMTMSSFFSFRPHHHC